MMDGKLEVGRAYTGVGSRSTPKEILALMRRIALGLRHRGYVLRSGGARGADEAFQAGAGGQCEIFLPRAGFNDQTSTHCEPPQEAFELAARHHPAWERCSAAARRLHARNVQQILGADLSHPTDFVVCWTPGGLGGGGTGQAIRNARFLSIPVFDLGKDPRGVTDELRARFKAVYE